MAEALTDFQTTADVGTAGNDNRSISQKRAMVRAEVLTGSRHIRQPNFDRFYGPDLIVLFELYDAVFFAGELRQRLTDRGGERVDFEFSRRLRSSGGTTTSRKRTNSTRTIKPPNPLPAASLASSQLHPAAGRPAAARDYTIAVSTTLLATNFATPTVDGGHSVVGLRCTDRLDALMRIFEHELLHLLELLRYGNTRCSAGRFQLLARQYFGHIEHKHRMPTQRQQALQQTTLRPGVRVSFNWHGRSILGVVNNIHRRATVLVESPAGQCYSNGGRYQKFYVPLNDLVRED